MKLNKIGYSLKDVAIVQAPISNELHRGDVDPYINVCNRDVLPIFVAPMATVTDENNYDVSLRLAPFIYKKSDYDIINDINVDKCLVEFLRVKPKMKEYLDEFIDFDNYSLKER